MKYKIILKWLFPILLLAIGCKIQTTHYNWDVVFYCGAIFNDADNPDTSRKEMIKAFRDSPYIDYEDQITPKTQYGRDVFNNNQAYEEQYAFYDIRIIYIKTIQIFHAFGVDAVYSVYLASLFYALCSVIAIYFFCLAMTKNIFFSFIVGLFVMLKPDFKEFITSSPDTLAAFSIILVVIAYFSRKNWPIYISVFFSIICRTDNIIFIALLFGLTLVRNIIKKEDFKVSVFSIFISVFFYIIINLLYNNAGYRVLYFHTFVEHLSFPLSQPKTISFIDIFKRVIPEIPYFIYPLMYLLGLIVIVKGRLKDIFTQPALLVALVAIITFVIRFCLFPSIQARFTFQYELLGIIVIVYFFKDSLYLFFNSEKK
ncbi:hypothetical protein PGH12_13920 [Chryseobacterium wangxinyae]|uniref:hypothetical protein n=1 Tax=Chryseobacterium sp. CY350 TaxID=2997336 RepID=UPI0022718807|nr:hypothetical protein [Chryseobacterium sp. CY350]MCY0975829.1 hypothetical protein [Chryseobacterium sp. CY350]WBZ94562.1 hypothetical protein PGH12_13920 [Chryseobacterium sp. CY350]